MNQTFLSRLKWSQAIVLSSFWWVFLWTENQQQQVWDEVKLKNLGSNHCQHCEQRSNRECLTLCDGCISASAGEDLVRFCFTPQYYQESIWLSTASFCSVTIIPNTLPGRGLVSQWISCWNRQVTLETNLKETFEIKATCDATHAFST